MRGCNFEVAPSSFFKNDTKHSLFPAISVCLYPLYMYLRDLFHDKYHASSKLSRLVAYKSSQITILGNFFGNKIC